MFILFINSSTIPYHRTNHVLPYDSTTSTTASSSRPYYSSYLNSGTSGLGSTGSSSIPLTDSSSPSRRTTISSSYLTSTTGSEAIYSTVNKPSRTTDLYPTSASTTTTGGTSNYLRRDHLDDDDDIPSYRSSSLLDRGYGTSSTISGNTTSSWSASDSTSGIGSRYRSTGASDLSSDLSTKPRSYLTDYNSSSSHLTSPPTSSSATIGSDPLIKPLIGSGSAISTQLYPSKFTNSNSSTISTLSETRSRDSSSTYTASSLDRTNGITSNLSGTGYRSSYSNI